MQLQYDDKSTIPAESADSFEEFEQDGKTVFMHKDLAAQKRETYRNQGQLTNLSKKLEGLESNFASQQAEAVKAAELRAAAELEDERNRLVKANDHEGAHKLDMEQAASALASMTAERDEQIKINNEFQEQKINSEKMAVALEIATEFTIADNVKMVAGAIFQRLASADGKIALTDASGQAVADDMQQETLRNDPLFKGSAKAPGSSGGVGARGGQNNVGGGLDLNKPYSDMSSKERVAYIKRNKKAG